MEFTSITAVLSGITNATEIAKLIKNSGTTLEAAEIKYKLAELIDSLADAKIEVANIKELLLEKESEIKQLKSEINTNEIMVYEAPFYFQKNSDTQKDGPFCQKCYDSEKKIIRLQTPNNNGFWICNVCNSNYTDSTFKDDGPDFLPGSNGSTWI